MPQVRSYGARKVRATPLPDQRVETRQAQPTAAAFGATAGRGMEAFGEQAFSAGARTLSILGEQAAQRRNQADQTAVLEADNQLASWETDRMRHPETGALNVHGKAALDLTHTVGDEFTKAAGEIAATLTTDRQRLGFAGAKARRWQNLHDTLETHASNEFNRWQAAETEKGIENAASAAIANATDPRRVSEELAMGLSIVRTHAQAQGLGPEATMAAQQNFQTVVHHGVITQLLSQGKDRAAQVYFDETKDQISGEAQSKIRQALESATVEGEGLRTATDLWQQLGPKSDTDPIALDAMEEAARQKYADDPKTLKATMAFLRERKAAVDASRADRSEALAGGLWKAVAEGATVGQLRTMPAYLNAPGKLQAQLRDYLVQQAEHTENRAAAAESRAAARESRAYTREQRAEQQTEREGLYMYYQYAKPERLTQMSDDQVWQLVPSIGLGNVQRLLEQRQKVKTDPAALDDFRSDDATVDGVLRGAHIDPNPALKGANADPDGAANVGWFKEQVAAEQRRVQAVTKKKVTNAELEAIAKRILGQQVIERGWFWNSSKSLVNATIADVPPADRTGITAEFAKRGTPNPTDDQILAAWRSVMVRKQP